jgi:hypothetical protein
MHDGQFVRISHGPRFSGILSTIGLFAALTCLGLTIYSINEGDIISAAAYALFTVACVAVFLDFRGVEIDFNHRKIRQYRSFLGLRTGTWESVDDFDKITLTWYRIRGLSATARISQSWNSSSSDSYFVLLETADGKNPFEIGEYASHRAAQKVMRQMAKQLSLPHVDAYQKKLDAIAKRRLQREAHRTGQK